MYEELPNGDITTQIFDGLNRVRATLTPRITAAIPPMPPKQAFDPVGNLV